MRVSVVGCGYLGAVHAAAMAALGHQVIAVDTDPARVGDLAAGRPPFNEPGFREVLHAGLRSGRLSFTDWSSDPRLGDVQVHFIAVGTPQSAASGAADLRCLEAAVDSLTTIIPRGNWPVVVGKSTVPVGTAARVAERLRRHGAVVVWNPEFLREGFAVDDTLHPDRIVYGVSDVDWEAEYGARMLDGVYARLLAEGIPRMITDYATAELVKVAANAFLATKISFINAMAELCEVSGADVTVLADAIGQDPRIGRKFLNAGVGFGGGCLPKDIRALRARAAELGVPDAVSFLGEVDAINQRRRDKVVELAEELSPGGLRGTRVTVLGAAFKPNSDDIRDSPALDVALQMADRGALVRVCDPQALPRVARTHPELDIEADLDRGLTGAELVVLLTEWPEYAQLDPEIVAGRVARRVVIDGRNVLDARRWRDAGWIHVGLGRRNPHQDLVGMTPGVGRG